MNDTFLYLARPKPRADFKNALYARINQQPNRLTQFLLHLQTRRGFATAFFVFLAIGACGYQIVNSTFHHAADVNGVAVYESNDLLSLNASSMLEHFLDEDPSVSIGAQPNVPVEQALSSLDYSLNLPKWLPVGFELVDPIYDNYKNWDFAFSLSWYSEEHDAVLALITHQRNGSSLETAHVFPGAWEVIDIKGTQVLVIRGAFELPFDSREEARQFLENDGESVEQRWNDEAGIVVKWVYDGIYYELSSPTYLFPWLEPEDQYIVPEEDLLRMADSMIPQD